MCYDMVCLYIPLSFLIWLFIHIQIPVLVQLAFVIKRGQSNQWNTITNVYYFKLLELFKVYFQLISLCVWLHTSMSIWCNDKKIILGMFKGRLGCCYLGYPSEAHLKLKSHRIWFYHNIHLSCPIILKFCTQQCHCCALCKISTDWIMTCYLWTNKALWD